MNSFYGGKEGRSYAIIKQFHNQQEMIDAFKLGAGYTEVNYGEYVIIDTIFDNQNNPNNPNNGKIYRRGINYSNSVGGAIYIGQIQGPEGKMAPLTIMSIEDLDQIGDEDDRVIIEPYGDYDYPSPDIYAIDQDGTTHAIKLGFRNHTAEDGSDMQSAIGLDIPKPVVRMSAKIVQASELAKYQHEDATGLIERDNVDFNNPIHQSTKSINAAEDGVQYYDYQIAIPQVGNLSIESEAEIDLYTQKPINFPFNYNFLYNTVQDGEAQRISKSTDIEIPVVLQSIGDALYYRTNKNNVGFLGNPNGQFHVYAHIKDNAGIDFTTDEDIIEYLNNLYPYGIRTEIESSPGTYDITQAGWLIAVDKLEEDEQENTYTTTSLYGFDYRTEDGQDITIEILRQDPGISLKGWFKVQGSNPGSGSNASGIPQKIVLIGNDSNSEVDYGNISDDEKSQLQEKGIWFKSEDSGGKWWV